MSNNGRAPEDANEFSEARKDDSHPVLNELASPADANVSNARYAELQSAMRFPLKLAACVKSASGERTAETQNISANGVLFQMEGEMPIGSTVDFTISLPSDVLGADADVRLDGRGRVVRQYEENGQRGFGVVIDEYRFERR
jgi:PilZ domain